MVVAEEMPHDVRHFCLGGRKLLRKLAKVNGRFVRRAGEYIDVITSKKEHRVRAVTNMVFATLLVCLSQQVYAQECDFDQDTRIRDNIQLKKKYPGSYLAGKNLVLVVPVREGEVRINIGGCVDYGVTVELRLKHASPRRSVDELMQKILYLAKTYSQNIVELEKLQNAIQKNDWTQPQEDNRDFFLNYDSAYTFEGYEHDDRGGAVIGFSLYH